MRRLNGSSTRSLLVTNASPVPSLKPKSCPSCGYLHTTCGPTGSTPALTGASFGEFIPTCAAFGINRTAAFALKKAGLLTTFKLPGMKSNFIHVAELESLPERLAVIAAAKDGAV